MIKNTLISIMLLYIINSQPGKWAVSGNYKTVYCIILFFTFEMLLAGLDVVVTQIKEEINEGTFGEDM